MGVITRMQFLGGTDLLKFGSAKNVQNLVRFTTVFKFDSKYLWNRWILTDQNPNGVDKHDHFGVEQQKIVKFRKQRTKL